MLRSFVLTYWEVRRVRRSRAACAAVLILPVAAVAAHMLLGNAPGGALLGSFFPALAVVLGSALVWMRSVLDRASGFAAGLESTPAAGAIVLRARVLLVLLLVLVQTAIFYGLARVVG